MFFKNRSGQFLYASLVNSTNGAAITSGATIEIAGGVAEVTLNRPDKLNALDPAMFEALGKELKGATRPAHYLAIPPTMFEQVLEELEHCGCTTDARIIVEKPFGHDLASACHPA